MTDQEKTNGTDAAIDASLTTPYPRRGVVGAAARAMKANRFAEAAQFMTRGRAAMDQVVFNVVLHDPSFFQESWRPEIAPFYAEPGAPRPAASRSAAAAPAESAAPASAQSATPSH